MLLLLLLDLFNAEMSLEKGWGVEGGGGRDAVYIYIYIHIITVARFKDVYYFRASAGHARLKTVHVHLTWTASKEES